MGIILKDGYESVYTYRHYVYAARSKVLDNFESALARAKRHFNDYDDESYVVIIVECYPTIAHVDDEFTPIEINRTVFPYDGDAVYPMQAIKQTISFMNYRECMACEEWPPM